MVNNAGKLFLFFALLSADLFGQHYNFSNVTTDDGLPTSESYHISIDRKGYLWISTSAGLARFNGKTFRIFNTSTGLTDNTIYRTFEDAEGRLFYFSGSSRIGYIKNDTSFTLPVTDTLARILSHGQFFVNDLCDYDHDNFLISTQRGFYLLDKKTLSRLRLIPQGKDISFWLKVIDGKAHGAFYYNNSTRLSHGKTTFNLYVENRGASFIIPVEMKPGGPGPSIFKTLRLADGRILAGFTDQVFIISPDGSYKVKQIPATLTSLNQDSKGNIWIGMLHTGMYLFPAPKDPAMTTDLDAPPQHLLEKETPTGVKRDPDGGTWISTLDNGLYYCPNMGIVSYPDISLLSSRLNALNRIGDHVLVSGLTNTIYAFKNKNDFRPVHLPQGKNIRGAYSFVRNGNKIYAAGYGNSFELDTALNFLKIITDEKGESTYLYNFCRDSMQQLIGIHYTNLFRLSNDVLFKGASLSSRGRDIATDRNFAVYVGTNQGLLMLKDKALVPVISAKINKLRTDQQGNMWVCTDSKGLLQVNGKTLRKKLTTDDGLPSNLCNDVAFDNHNNMWIATNKGLCFINHQHPQMIYTFRKENGLLNNEILKLEIRDDELYIATQKGLCIADINELQPDNLAPPVYISSVTCNNLPVTGHIFSCDQNNLVFKAEGLCYQNNRDLCYEYRLAGYDSTWYKKTTGEMTFNNLADGSYVFEVRAINAHGVKSEMAAFFPFMIQKPIWKEIWFILLATLFFSGILYMSVRKWVETAKAGEVRKAAMIKIMSDYHMTALRAQMNPHFIFNAINSIQHYILTNEKQQAYDYLAKFSKLIRQVLINSKENTITLKKEIELLELYLDIEKLRFKDRFEYTITYEDSLPIEEIRIPIMLVQPFVENAIWHGIMNLDKNKVGVLSILFEYKNDHLRITVEDNGVGRAKAEVLKNSNEHEPIGISLSRERLEALAAMGCKDARIEVTDLHNDTGASGTRVEIYLTTAI